MELSERIKALREHKRIKLNEIATTLGVDVSNYAKIEKKGKKLTLERIEEIAEALGVTLGELLRLQDSESIMTENIRLKTENENLLKEIGFQQNKITELQSRISDKELIISSLKKDLSNLEFLFQARIQGLKQDIKHKHHIGTLVYADENGDEQSVPYSSLSDEQADILYENNDAHTELTDADNEQIIDLMFTDLEFINMAAFLVSTGLVEDEQILQAYKEKFPNFYGNIPYGYYEHLKLSNRKLISLMNKKDTK